jgi:fructosamine-3-kinase
MWPQIAEILSQALGQPFEIIATRSVSGGDINQGYRVERSSQTVPQTIFVKLNRADRLAMFEAEFQGLQQMWDTQTIRVPRPLAMGIVGNSSFIAMEWLELGRSQPSSWRVMGQKLAAMHQFRGATAFGWVRDNTIGSTPQPNPWTNDWTTFWQQQRIGFQIELAERKGARFSAASELLAAIPALLVGHQPQPSIVHGDLWGGNASILADGEPVIYDPAMYWGDREVDLAMTELFGGFPAEFYAGYEAVWPLDEGYGRRKMLYNLYHILNHYNLFGGGYAGQADRMMGQLLR